MSSLMTVHLAYMDKDVQWHETLQVPIASTILEVLESSGWLWRDELMDFRAWIDEVKGTNIPTHKAWYVGVYAQKQPINYILEPNDRVEIYRPLTIDPMAKRKAKSKHKHKHKSPKQV